MRAEHSALTGKVKRPHRNNPQRLMQGTQVYSAVVDGSDPELLAHGVWHILMQKGTPVPDCGIYYAALHRASATEEEKCEVLDHVGKYAVCMVTLSQGVKESA